MGAGCDNMMGGAGCQTKKIIFAVEISYSWLQMKNKSSAGLYGVFGAVAAVLFACEVLIAVYAKGFVRNHLGDVLVVILLYCLVRTFFRGFRMLLPVYIFLFAVLVEAAQACRITDMLSISRESVLAVVTGTSFDWGDILCYAAGSVACIACDKLFIKKTVPENGL